MYRLSFDVSLIISALLFNATLPTIPFPKGIFINKYEMKIFDRWGNLIFFSDEPTKPWDGRANHGPEIAQQDVYIYSIDVFDIKRKKKNYKG